MNRERNLLGTNGDGRGECQLAFRYLGADDKAGLPDEDEKKLIGSLIAISTGVHEVRKLSVPTDIGRKLLACYDQLGQE